MRASPTYLDFAATTPLHPRVLEAMQPFLCGPLYGNPSSVHSLGRAARQAVEEARAQVAGLIGAESSEIVLTSGGTESDNLGVAGAALGNQERGRHVLMSAVEHHAVLHAGELLRPRGFDVEVVPVDRGGRVRPQDILERLRPDTVLVSCMWVNNETGAVQPVGEIAAACRLRGILFHCDAVQAVGLLEVDARSVPFDLLSMSAHKIYGPKGAGALYVRRGIELSPLLRGGSQENQRRAGTENVAAMVGFGAAARLAAEERSIRWRELATLSSRLEQVVRSAVPLSERLGPDERVPSIHSYRFPETDGEALLYRLDLEGFAASMGAACSSGALSPSHVVTSMGYSKEEAWGVLRFSLGVGVVEEDLVRLGDALKVAVPGLPPLKGTGALDHE